jgi:hypothetical protein
MDAIIKDSGSFFDNGGLTGPGASYYYNRVAEPEEIASLDIFWPRISRPLSTGPSCWLTMVKSPLGAVPCSMEMILRSRRWTLHDAHMQAEHLEYQADNKLSSLALGVQVVLL